MDRQQIALLHERASEHYLRGEFAEAMVAWQSLLVIDPDDEQALEGVRLAKMLANGNEPDAPPAPTAHAAPVLAAPAAVAAASLGSDAGAGAAEELAIDLGVLENLSTRIAVAKPLAAAAPGGAPPAVSVPDEPVVDGDAEVGKELAAGRPAGSDAAEDELKLRVRDLLDEATKAESEGRIDDALSILARVFILDEQNDAAAEIEQRLRAAQGQSSRDAENWLAEGAQDFEAGRLDAARVLFQKVLDRYPSHLEALDYMERVDAALAAQEGKGAAETSPAPPVEDLLSPAPRFEPANDNSPNGPRTMADEPASTAIPLQQMAGNAAASEDLAAGPFGSECVAAVPYANPATVPAAAPRSPGLPWPLLIGFAVLVVAVAAGAAVWYAPKLFRRGGAPAPAPAPVESVAKTAQKPRPVEEAAPAPSEVPSAKSVPEAMARARAAMASGDYAAAVIAYNAALTLDPGLDEARAGLMQAGEKYKIEKVEREQLDRARASFAEGEYTPALKILYRMPPGKYGDDVERYKANAWFNLGVIALRAGNCKEAQEHLGEALQIRPADPDFRRAREFAQKYQSVAKDRSFYDVAEAIPFHKIDD